jgi:hypothetical protein
MTRLTPYIGCWMILAAFVLVLALYRRLVAAHEEDRYVHISQGESRLLIGVALACTYSRTCTLRYSKDPHENRTASPQILLSLFLTSMTHETGLRIDFDPQFRAYDSPRDERSAGVSGTRNPGWAISRVLSSPCANSNVRL